MSNEKHRERSTRAVIAKDRIRSTTANVGSRGAIEPGPAADVAPLGDAPARSGPEPTVQNMDIDSSGTPGVKAILDRSAGPGAGPPERRALARPSLRMELLKRLQKEKLLDAFEDFEESEEGSDEEATQQQVQAYQ